MSIRAEYTSSCVIYYILHSTRGIFHISMYLFRG